MKTSTLVSMFAALVASAALCACGICAEPGSASAPTLSEGLPTQQLAAGTAVRTKPFWQDASMDCEPLFFIRRTGAAAPTARLLFAPEGPVTMTSADGSAAYVEGKDFSVDQASHVVSLLPGSTMRFMEEAQLYPPKGAAQSIESYVKDRKKSVFWSEGHVFHDLQVVATYTHKDAWAGYTPTYAGAQLPSTVAKLAAGQPLSLVVLGDSISQGYNASKYVGVAPFQPPYPDLVTQALTARFSSQVKLTNLSIAGMTASWGMAAAQVKNVLSAKPDLLIIAFGMNDASGTSAASYSRQIKKIVDGVLAGAPQTEFILVATMTGNPDWIYAKPAVYPLYRAELAKLLTGPGVALADMTSMWTDVLAVKSFHDITGNGVNHPNDFGHRLYADVILGLLAP